MKRIASALAVLALIAVVGVIAVWHMVQAPTAAFAPPRVVSIRAGDSMTIAARRLATAGVVRSATLFAIYAEISGRANRLQPGDYAFKGGEAMPQVLEHLNNGDYMVVTPTYPLAPRPFGPYPRVQDKEFTANDATHYTFAFDVLGVPAISIPCGFSHDNFPIGLQLVARPFDEATLLRAAYAYEQATPWHTRHPTVTST